MDIIIFGGQSNMHGQSEYMNPYVRGHYSAKGLEKLGFEAGKTLASYFERA